MDDSRLSAALQEAANAYSEKRKLASHLPLEAAQIDFIALNSGISNAGLSLRRREAKVGRTRFARDEVDPASLSRLASDLSHKDLADLSARLHRELMTLRRYARVSDARYDLNRHAALVRLLLVLKNEEPNDGAPATDISSSPKEKGAPLKRNAL